MRLAGGYEGTLNADDDEDAYWAVEAAIPWSSFGAAVSGLPPQPGDAMRANFNRHGGVANLQYSQWSSADTPAPAFHTPHRFGSITLSSRVLPIDPQQVGP